MKYRCGNPLEDLFLGGVLVENLCETKLVALLHIVDNALPHVFRHYYLQLGLLVHVVKGLVRLSLGRFDPGECLDLRFDHYDN